MFRKMYPMSQSLTRSKLITDEELPRTKSPEMDDNEKERMRDITTSSNAELSWQDIRKYLKWALGELRASGNTYTLLRHQILNRILNMYAYESQTTEGVDEKIGGEMAALGYAEVIITSLKHASKNGGMFVVTELEVGLCADYTDTSDAFVEALAARGAIPFFTEVLTSEELFSKFGIYERTELKENSLTVLHNMARQTQLKGMFQEANTSKAVAEFVNSDDEEERAVAMLTLAYIVDEDENSSLIDDTDTIGNCVSWLRAAVDNDENRRHRGFSAWELTLGLAKLAVNDGNKVKIVEEGALVEFLRLLQDDDPKEQAASSECLWTLSFDDTVREKILESQELISVLESLKDSKCKDVRKNVQGALWMIKGNNERSVRRPSSRGTASSEGQGHIFISYSWNEKEMVKRIHKSLVGAGYTVWVDWEKMGGSTLQAMAEAVENSAVVLICMSEKYKQSPNCRTEAEYTYQQKKEYIPLLLQLKYRPDGWLGALLGAKLFFDFSGKYPYEQPLQNLLKELKGKVSPGLSKQISRRQEDVPDSLVSGRSEAKTSCASLTKEEVQKLFKENDIEPVPSGLVDFNGKLLWQLKRLRDVDAPYFHRSLEVQFGLGLVDVLKLSAVLEQL